jgi:NADH:ubiquinone oxidoreductase subunit E
MSEKLNIRAGETTDDLSFSLTEVRCIGACSLAPVVVINEETYGKVTPKQVGKLLNEYLEKPTE